jgi:hypothetical protein
MNSKNAICFLNYTPQMEKITEKCRTLSKALRINDSSGSPFFMEDP